MAKDAKILVVDDEETIRELFKEYLMEDGFLVTSASSGKDALAIIKSENFNLLLIDLIMPDMDGLQLAGEIRKLKIDAPVVLLTAYEMDMDEAKQRELNITDYISKGVPMSEVSAKIKNLLGG